MVFFTTFHFVDPDLMLLRGVPVSLLSSMPFFLRPPGHELAQHPSRYGLSPLPIQILTRLWPSSSFGSGPIPAWCLRPHDAHPRDCSRLQDCRQVSLALATPTTWRC